MARHKVLIKVVGFVALAYAAVCVGLAAFQDRFIYFPEPMTAQHPADLNLRFRDLSFTSSDGTRLHAWFFPAPNARASLLHAHGNAGNLSHRTFVVRPLLDLGINVLLFDYRGYGRSEGRPSEQGLYADAEAALRTMIGQPEAAGKPIVYYGESLGGAIATELALRQPPSALVLQSTFTSLPDMAQRMFPWLPVRWLTTAKYASVEKAPRIKCPVLVVHGDHDSVVPFEIGKRLFDAFPEGHKRFLPLAGADHNDVWDRAEEPVAKAIGAMLTNAP